jgi:hypothetical protein
MQRSRRKGIMSVGYMDPLIITQNTLKLNERETLNVMDPLIMSVGYMDPF